mmetsp:Transcript_21353/g.44325  ORF Transcript_21353/g.44325 Transcript_21353/m.44325 type:complete len:299 (-) Transcript_21353:221-1117(-)
MSMKLVCLLPALAMTWSLAAASPPQPQLRGSTNTTLKLQSAGLASATHLVWKDWATSLCLSSDGNRIGNGVKVQLWQCDQTWGSGGQNFILDSAGRIRMHGDPRYCVVVDGDRHADGSHIQLWECNDADQKQVWAFSLSGKMLATWAPTQMCMAVDANRAFNGARIQLWSCDNAWTGSGPQDWLQVTLGKDGRTAYAVPNEDKACSSPFVPVSQSVDSCLAAAEALRPGSGCSFPGTFMPWAKVLSPIDRPSWPQGCSFYGGCQYGCGLDFNPSGAGASCPTQGQCMSISVICQLSLP